jgi:hypothetical protein
MKLLLLAITLIAFGTNILTAHAYGITALGFSFCLVIFYFLGLMMQALNAAIQGELNPGIERLEPSFWSSVYNAWLHRTDPQKWIKYATTFALIFTALLGSIMGALIAVSARPHAGLPPGTYESWLAGFFLTCSIAWAIVSADHWKTANVQDIEQIK